MKRLTKIMLSMQESTTTYAEMYQSPALVYAYAGRPPEQEQDNRYFHGGIGYVITKTNKLALDKPTVTIEIPIKALGLQGNYAEADYCLRAFAPYIDALNQPLYNRTRPDHENGKFLLYRPGGEILVRNTAYFEKCPQKDYENGSGISLYLHNDGQRSEPQLCLCIRMQIQFPRKRLKKAILMIGKALPQAVQLFIDEFDSEKLNEIQIISRQQQEIRSWLKNSDYCAFIANGSILPRSKGTDLPMENAIPFQSPQQDEIEVFGIRGMGIKRGVTVITGGGYSGKSTLLDAISAGIYDHVLGDGRELCITDASAITISAEDGRSAKCVNISPFIQWLPNGDTKKFSTEHASGSTSQATNIMEAIDFGCKLLLIDEDRSATNFMIRDQMMKELIQKEPIMPFTDRVRELYDCCNVSTILVIGGSGEYLSVADRIYLMEEFSIRDVTDPAKKICAARCTHSALPPIADWKQNRILLADEFTSYPEGRGSEYLLVSDMGFLMIGSERIDLRGLHNIVSKRQLDALGFLLRYLESHNSDPTIDLDRKIDELYRMIEKEGLDAVFSDFFTVVERFLDLPRKVELKAVICRMRKIIFASNN